MSNIHQGPASKPPRQPDRLPGAVTIKPADFNGQTFDGSPFDGDAPWLKHAIECGNLQIADVTDRDYAVFDVRTAEGTIRAFPGDQITLEADGFLRVHPHPDSKSDWARFPKMSASERVMERIASDHFVLTICDNVVAPQRQHEEDYEKLTAEMETGSSDTLTLSVLNNAPPERDIAVIALNKRQVGNLLMFLTMLHPLMNDE